MQPFPLYNLLKPKVKSLRIEEIDKDNINNKYVQYKYLREPQKTSPTHIQYICTTVHQRKEAVS
jgi:hypothetical protein